MRSHFSKRGKVTRHPEKERHDLMSYALILDEKYDEGQESGNVNCRLTGHTPASSPGR
jgi:hypothetical protein